MRDYLTLRDKFRFSCHKGIECFNKCCYDLSLFLTPYDIIRLKNRLGLTSTEFLKRYTRCHIGYQTGLPVVTLKMRDDLRCPFVTDDGCSVYEDRPGSCRLYPLARVKIGNGEIYYIVREEHCMGFEENKVWTVEEWIKDQGAIEYNRMNDLFMRVISKKNEIGRELSDEELRIVYLACFDVDRFRKYAMEKSLSLPESDVEIMKFGINWVVNEVLV